MDVAGLVFTAVGTLTGIVAAYFGWVAVRPKKRPARPAPLAPSEGSGTEGAVAPMYDVFISYSQDDLDWVTEFAERLEAEGVKVARDEVVFRLGDVLVHAIEKAIRDSAHGLLVFSPASLASGWVKQEYAAMMQRSIEKGLRFIPVIIKDVQLPEFAATRYYADFRHVSDVEYDQLIGKLAEAVQNV
jgi:hypothetical protein